VRLAENATAGAGLPTAAVAGGQRTADASVMSGRRRSAAASTLRAASTVATTCSIASSSPGK
jgi:hypothetical protein